MGEPIVEEITAPEDDDDAALAALQEYAKEGAPEEAAGAKAEAEPQAPAEPDRIQKLEEQVENQTVGLRQERQEKREMAARMERILGIVEEQNRRLIHLTTRPAPPPPKFEEDPEGAMKHAVEEGVSRLEKKHEEAEAGRRAEMADREEAERVKAYEAADRAKYLQEHDMSEEDFAGARDFYFRQRFEQFQAFNPSLPAEAIQRHMISELSDLWRDYASTGQSITAAVMAMAKGAGYQPDDGTPAGKAGGKPARSPALEKVAQKQAGPISLSDAGPAGPPSPDKIRVSEAINMSDEEFAKWERSMLKTGITHDELQDKLFAEFGEEL